MARRIRLWSKKRGERRSGSPRLGGFGEAVFFAVLLLLGLVSLAAVIALQLEYSTRAQLYFSGWGLWLRVSVAAVFILIGGAGVVISVVRVSASAERRSAIGTKKSESGKRQSDTIESFPAVPEEQEVERESGSRLPYRLPAARSLSWQLLIVALFCIGCVTLASISVVLAVAHHISGDPKWGLTAMAIPALAAGLWSIYLFGRRLLIYTDIGATVLEISQFRLRPGGNYQLFLSQSGRLLMETIEVWLICEESATFQDGTDVRTEKLQVFERQIFVDEQLPIHPGEPLERECEFELPETAMHSFQSTSNSVHWSLVVYGKAPPWPPFERRFPIVVLPIGAEEPVV